MPHLNDGRILAWLDGEMEPGKGAGVREHLDSCTECRSRVDILRREAEGFSRAVLLLDDHALGLADPGPLPVAAAISATGRHRLRSTGWSLARAAGLVLVAAGAAAALVPGSPVRQWLDDLGDDAQPVAATPAVSSPAMEAPEEEGSAATATAISVEPLRSSVTVSLRGFSGSSNVHVRLTDAGLASVRVDNASEGLRFITGPGTLEVIGATEGEIWVELPGSIHEAVVLVDGEAAARIQDGRLVILWPLLDSPKGDPVFRIGG